MRHGKGKYPSDDKPRREDHQRGVSSVRCLINYPQGRSIQDIKIKHKSFSIEMEKTQMIYLQGKKK
ncbi:hypothetical protein AT2G45405 [Arabidopsis thaliana]|nr:uncharacterized protein AT2G45405 [Arabidopsis thaliana]ANM61690.1 hypothetical protein AT2G45405 [Arabidopsis thaliana]|eukprot:NP_001323893.1 hypothetical protein AT2G45405 [Arabidopsis thaliana]